MLITRLGTAKLSTPTFGNVNLTETKTDLLVACKFNQKIAEIISIYSKFIVDVNFTSWPGKSVISNFSQYQSHANNGKFPCCLEITENGC